MNFNTKPSIDRHIRPSHGGPYSVTKPDPQIIDFSSNVSPIGSPPLVRKTLKKLANIEIYPDPDSINLRKNLEWYTKISYKQIVVGNGATEIIYNFCQAFLSKKTPVLIPIPTFSEYEAAAKLAGAKISYFKTMNLTNDLEEFIQKIPKRGCIFVCNPNNPTGTLITKKELEKIIASSQKKSSLVFVDECFIELVPDLNESIVNLVKKYDNLFVLRSLTKSFGLAGVRLGYGLGSKTTISILNNIKIPWNVNGLAQQAGGAAICDFSYIDKAKQMIKKESKFLRKKISTINGFECHFTQTNFILIKTKMKSTLLQNKLLKQKILIRDCSTFRGLNDHYIRIAVKKRKENEKLIQALEDVK